MQTFLKEMKESLHSNGHTNRKLATRFGVTHTTVNNYFNKKNKFDFMHFVDMLRLYEPKNVNYRRERIKEMIPLLSHKNSKLALEVMDMFGEYELQQLVIDKIKKNTNNNTDENEEEKKKKGNSKTVRTNLKIISFYELLRKRSEGKISAKDFFEEVERMRKTQKHDENELMILSDLNVIYSFFDLGNYKMVNEYIQQVLPTITNLKCRTYENSFLLRIKEMKVFIELHDNKLEEARELAFEIINNETNCYISTKAVAYCKIGESYVFSDYKKAKEYMEKSLEIIGEPVNKKLEKRRDKVLNTILFLKIFHGKDLHTINVDDLDPAEKAFLYIKLGMNTEAIKILKDLETRNGFLSNFQLYYMGLAIGGEEGKKYLEMSSENFSKSGDFFYISLPNLALKCYNRDIHKGGETFEIKAI
ncbi:AimR family lysis-lysogeny pheromone receptor [Bacillus sp. AFS075034]|uniref:AimR family lysis-lysogeny pheromone receptor n=1 Tax=Bacillus sp. AFS075034 TaxID=2034281 RepID=UPI000BF4C930|nr:AimR family lysis-lysogeny pheromone receptor [Bacillus sp. AFS075034]PFW60805.1 hypothetical protein COL20_20445 [Bacillus sp. AFS075034]